MDRKTCVVTGATTGIGKETARGLAAAGADVLMICRNPELGRVVQAELQRNAGQAQRISLFVADLSRQADVRRVADEITAAHDHVDVLVNNAGALNMQRSVSAEGYETTFAVNHLAYFLLTALLMGRLRAAPRARIINVASRGHAHGSGTIDFDDLDGERRYSGPRAYFQSKLANVLFTNELARRLGPNGITVNSLHPGDVGSGFGRNNRGLLGMAIRLAKPFLLTPERGAETSIHLAVSPEVDGKTGLYFARKRAVPSSPQSMDDRLAKRLWQISEVRTGYPYAAIGL